MFTLSEIHGKGHIKQCLRGCVHFTYGAITLHFRNAETLQHLAEAWSSALNSVAEQDLVEIQYGRIHLMLRAHEAGEVEYLLQRALQHPCDLCRPQEVDSEDSVDWPEGEVFVPIPDLTAFGGESGSVRED